MKMTNLRAANVARDQEWNTGSERVSMTFRATELAGEVGEACNVIKKLERERIGLVGSRDTKEHLAEELADIIICTDLVAMDAGIDLDGAIAAKFNATSEKNGLSTRLSVSNPAARSLALEEENAALRKAWQDIADLRLNEDAFELLDGLLEAADRILRQVSTETNNDQTMKVQESSFPARATSFPNAEQNVAMEMDWVHVGKMACKFGVRYATNNGLVDFLKSIRALSSPEHVDADKVHDYVQEYEFRADNGGGYTPTDGERALIEDAIQGFIADAGKVEGDGWLDIASAPMDKTPVIIAVPTKDKDGFIVGEAYFDPANYEGGDWWWAGTSHTDHFDSPISEINHNAPTHWRPIPSAPSQEVAGT